MAPKRQVRAKVLGVARRLGEDLTSKAWGIDAKTRQGSAPTALTVELTRGIEREQCPTVVYKDRDKSRTAKCLKLTPVSTDIRACQRHKSTCDGTKRQQGVVKAKERAIAPRHGTEVASEGQSLECGKATW
ncbi:hypothetical protein HAX54_047307 [Datura stramonium]|uniref:Uncharacterized protein n=1 Tax=Datura stramonium TaxID=4076 RepID=A0ABS8WKE1_DATST|nr:hypothetical protein [Datura stramonium]